MENHNHNDELMFLEAATNGDLYMLEECVRNRGVDINTIDIFKETALTSATLGGHILCLNFLINNGVNVNARSGRQVQTALTKSARCGDLECMRLLIENGADLNLVDHEQRTALMKASANNRTDCVRLLVDKGAFVNAVDNAGCTALMNAAMNGNAENVGILLNAQAIIDITDSLGQTALMKAASGGHVECVQFLLQSGANTLKMDRTSASALVKATGEWCVHNFNEELENNIVARVDDTKRMERDYQCIQLLCAYGADVNIVDNKGETILMKASAVGFRDCVTYLLQQGATVNAINDCGQTALMLAAKNGHEEVLTLLLTHNAQVVNLADMTGQTALMLAMMSSNYAGCMKLLLAHNADPNVVDEDCWTPLIHMSNVGNADTVRLLIVSGAYVGMKDKDGFTALDRARKENHEEIIHILNNRL